jgi:hypothetical protein
LNETSDNFYDHYRENPFSVLEPPPIDFGDAARASARDLAEDVGLSYVDEDPLELDGPSVARVGPDTLARLGSVPVRRGDGSLRVVVSETTSERIAAVREHFSTEVALGIVTPSTLERLLDAARTPATDAAGADDVGQNFERVLSLFDEEAGRFQVLREKLQQLGGQMSEREQHVRQLEAELARLRAEQQQDRVTIDGLRHDLAEREGRLELAGAKAEELAAIIRASGPR